MKWFKWILLPLSLIFWFITEIRNQLYDFGILKTKEFKIPIIGIGNISVGGTGKTPHTEYIAKILKDEYKISLLSKGYGRKTQNVNYVHTNSNPIEVGDESLQTKRNFPDQIVAVDHHRVNGVEKILSEHQNIRAIILDDAFQHRSIKLGYNILLCDYNIPFYEDYIMPVGKLRESRKGIKRADCIIVTKCPQNLKKEEAEKIANKINKKEIFFSTFKYEKVIAVFDSKKTFDLNKQSIIVVTGIANSNPLLHHLKQLNVKANHLKYADHHNYKNADIKKIITAFKSDINNEIILTTEKDAQKLKEYDELSSFPLYYLKVTVDFLWNKDKFDKKIMEYVKSN